MRQSVYCLASDNICSLIEHWFYSGSLSCHINLTPCVLLSGESTISPKFGSMLRPGRITVLFFLHSHGPLQWDGRSGSTEVVIDHTGLLIPPDVIFMFSSCRRGGGESLFYKCLLLFSAGEKSRVWRECGVTCQSKPAETRWVSHCRRSGDQLAVHWNSSDTPGSPLTVKSDYSLVQNERLSGLSAKPWQTKLTSPASDWVQECLTSRCKVIPSGKVWRNADLRRVGRKGSECLWRSPCAIDDLTAGQP